ncbi:MAG: Rha family transcriptional regulator [Methyloprofundus sp.]|nr:Rha family transcriptional regulator [Methyloprofundus sp.]
MQEIEITRIKNELRTDSRLLASFLDHRHRTILENVDKYSAELLELGRLPFETEKGKALEHGGFAKASRFALLNEDQCYFLMTLMRNNAKVVKAKLALVKSFRDARVQLAEHDAARVESKKVRRLEADSIKLLVEYASAHGSKSAERYYTNVTRMTNELLGIKAGQRDSLDATQLKQMATLETIVDLAIRDGIRAGMEYKEVYQLAKTRAGALVKVMGLSKQTA